MILIVPLQDYNQEPQTLGSVSLSVSEASSLKPVDLRW